MQKSNQLMTTSGLTFIETKPQDPQQVHDGNNVWSYKKKLYITFLIRIYFTCWNQMVFILNIIYSINALFMFLPCQYLFWILLPQTENFKNHKYKITISRTTFKTL